MDYDYGSGPQEIPQKEASVESLSAEVRRLKKKTRNMNRMLWGAVAVGFLGLIIVGVFTFVAFGTNFNDNDEINDLQREQKHNHELFKRHHIPPTDVRILNDPYPEYAFNQVSGNEDDDDHASGNFKADGDVEFFHKFDSNGNVIPGTGSLTSHGPMRVLDNANVYGLVVTNGTTTDRLFTLWSGSNPVEAGDVLGRRKSKASLGFADFESVNVASGVASQQGAHSFSIGDHQTIVQTIGAGDFRSLSIIDGTADDSDGLTPSNAILGSVAYSSAGDCLFAGDSHPNGEHFVVAYVDPAGSGGTVDLCKVTSVGPFSVSCAVAPLVVAAGETIIMNGVSHIDGTETFVVTWTSSTNGLQSFVATVDTTLMTITAGATAVIDAAHITVVCGHANAFNQGATMTYVWGSDAGTTIPMTAARYAVAGPVLSVSVAPVVLDTSLTASFSADNLGTSGTFFAIAVRDDANNLPGEVRLYGVPVGASTPALLSMHQYINPGAAVATTDYSAHLSPIGDDAILVSYASPSFESAPVAQVWHLYNDNSLVAGEARPIGLYTTNGVFCSALGSGDRAVCLHDTRSTLALGYQLRASKILMTASTANVLFPRGAAVVHQGATHPLGIAQNAALPGELVAVRIVGKSSTVGHVNQYTPNMDRLYIHGDGSVTPSEKPIGDGAATYRPIAGRCDVVTADTLECNFIGA